MRLAACEARLVRLPDLEAKVEFVEAHVAKQAEEQASTARRLKEFDQRLPHSRADHCGLEQQLTWQVEEQAQTSRSVKELSRWLPQLQTQLRQQQQQLADLRAHCEDEAESLAAAVEERLCTQLREDSRHSAADLQTVQQHLTKRIDEAEAMLRGTAERLERDSSAGFRQLEEIVEAGLRQLEESQPTSEIADSAAWQLQDRPSSRELEGVGGGARGGGGHAGGCAAGAATAAASVGGSSLQGMDSSSLQGNAANVAKGSPALPAATPTLGSFRASVVAHAPPVGCTGSSPPSGTDTRAASLPRLREAQFSSGLQDRLRSIGAQASAVTTLATPHRNPPASKQQSRNSSEAASDDCCGLLP